MKKKFYNLASAHTRVFNFLALFLFVFLLSGCPMKASPSESEKPRFTKLDAFNPHRSSFECKREADVNPPITPEADSLFQQALALDNHDIWPEQRDYPKVAALYMQAMKLGHWKAQFNLAGLYLKGIGVPQDTEKAIELTEDLMRKGVPAAWDSMGTYVMGGVGPMKQDATVAYAFWQRAADMGSMAAQTYIGAKLLGDHDEPPIFWGNRVIGLKMLECAFAQNYGPAAYELGLTLSNTNHEYARALKILHDGTRLGNEDSANELFSAFDLGGALVGNQKDKARAERYFVISNAIHINPDLRFPNLDKVLPLPPADLPMWNGDKQTLIDAAKAIVPRPSVPTPKPTSQPAAARVGRAHIPEGWVLPAQPQVRVPAQYETTSAAISGYWIARLIRPVTERHEAWNVGQFPMRYEEGELFDRSRTGLLPEDGRIMFHYVGEPVAQAVRSQVLAEDPRVARGVARYAEIPSPARRCSGHAACPETGTWSAKVPAVHPMAAVFNHWARQAYVEKGRHFPDLQSDGLGIDAREIRWAWLGNANESRADGLNLITLA